MLAALTVLLAALIVILAKDNEFWFPSAPASQSVSEPIEEALPQAKVQSPGSHRPIFPSAWLKIETAHPEGGSWGTKSTTGGYESSCAPSAWRGGGDGRPAQRSSSRQQLCQRRPRPQDTFCSCSGIFYSADVGAG